MKIVEVMEAGAALNSHLYEVRENAKKDFQLYLVQETDFTAEQIRIMSEKAMKLVSSHTSIYEVLYKIEREEQSEIIIPTG